MIKGEITVEVDEERVILRTGDSCHDSTRTHCTQTTAPKSTCCGAAPWIPVERTNPHQIPYIRPIQPHRPCITSECQRTSGGENMKFIKLMKALAWPRSAIEPQDRAPSHKTNRSLTFRQLANTWLGASAAEMQKVADANGIKMVEFDVQFDPARSRRSCRMRLHPASTTALSSVPSLFRLIPDIEEDRGGHRNRGRTDRRADLTTLIRRWTASRLRFWRRHTARVRHGTLTVQACEGDDNREVVFIYGIKGFCSTTPSVRL